LGQITYPKTGDKPLTRKEKQRIVRLEDEHEKQALEISFDILSNNTSFPIPPPIILHQELHVNSCTTCDQYGNKSVDCIETCPLCVHTGDCTHIRAGPHWKDHPHYIIAQEYINELFDIDHPHFAVILINSLKKSLARENKNQQDYEDGV
jgi:hypothetical protein